MKQKPILEVEIEYEVRDKDGKVIRKGIIKPQKSIKSKKNNEK